MNVYQHAIISLITGLTTGLVLAPERLLEVTGSAVFFGVMIDLDHFPISRIVHGEWRFLKGIMRNPVRAVFDVGSVVQEKEEFAEEYRYLSHSLEHLLLLGLGLYTGNILIYTGSFAAGLHLFSDIYADMFMW